MRIVALYKYYAFVFDIPLPLNTRPELPLTDSSIPVASHHARGTILSVSRYCYSFCFNNGDLKPMYRGRATSRCNGQRPLCTELCRQHYLYLTMTFRFNSFFCLVFFFFLWLFTYFNCVLARKCTNDTRHKFIG